MAVDSSPFFVPLGTALPDATLPDLTGNPVSLKQFANGLPLVVMWSANHCPYVQHVERLVGELADEFADKVAFVAISANDTTSYPDDDVAGLTEQQLRAGWRFPYLIDADQQVALKFRAACTPDFFVYDRDTRLTYRGACDSSTPKNGGDLTGELLRRAIDLTLNDQPVPLPHRPALGCGIKWREGNEPTT